MLDSFPGALRAFREENQLSLRELARLTFISYTHLCNIENGTRAATEEVAIRCDEALGTGHLLHVLLSIERGHHPMLRRVLFGGTLGLAGGALLANLDSTAALAATVNAAIRTELAGDWDAIAADFARRYVLQPGPAYGPEVAAQIMIAHQHGADGNTEAMRCAAALTLLYGLWIGDAGNVSVAQSLYATAAALADGTGDERLRAHIRARAASRGPYEGWSIKQSDDTARQALHMAQAGPAAVEAYAALVHLAALTGNLAAGRIAVTAMYDAADDDISRVRTASFDNYLECRAGSLADASRAYERCLTMLAPVPLWQKEAAIYYGRALVAAGDIDTGATLALDAARTLGGTNRIVGLGVRDLLSVVPAGVASEPVAALRGYATPGPVPWETLR